ncbi:hypothetical protein ACVBAX_06260 [Robertmurraya sp. GLU-23]
MKGMGEARNKFLANIHITTTKEYLPYRYKDWRYSTDFVSAKALELLKMRKWGEKELVFEHIVPKSRYIKVECESAAERGEISPDFIYNLLLKYYWTATIHEEENGRLEKDNMPDGWDGINIFARYNKAKVELLKHDKSYFIV